MMKYLKATAVIYILYMCVYITYILSDIIFKLLFYRKKNISEFACKQMYYTSLYNHIVINDLSLDSKQFRGVQQFLWKLQSNGGKQVYVVYPCIRLYHTPPLVLLPVSKIAYDLYSSTCTLFPVSLTFFKSQVIYLTPSRFKLFDATSP